MLDDTVWNLLVIGQPADAAAPLASELVHVQAIPAEPGNEQEQERAGIPRPSYYLLRPDGHIGLCGARFDAATVERYLTERLGISAGGRPA